MNYPKWLPQNLTAWLLCACVAVLLTFGSLWTHLSFKYGEESVCAAKDTLVHSKGLVTEVQRGAKRSVQVSDDTDTAVKHLDATLTKLDTLVAAGTGTLNAATGTVKQAGTLVATTNTQVAKIAPMAAETKAKIDKAIDAYATMPEHINLALDGLPPLEASLTNTSTATGNFINSPKLATLILNLGTMAGNGGEIIDNTNNFLYPVYHGTHPLLNKAKNVSLGLLGLGSKTAQTAYYGVGAWKGQ